MAVKKDKADAYMPLWIGDYQADTAHLDAEQHGAYLLLIMAYWRSGPLPSDDKKLAGIGRMTPSQWKRSRETILEFFQVADGKLHHKRIDAELKDANERKASARRSAEARWEKERRICETDANASVTHAVPQCSSPSPLSSPSGNSKPRVRKKKKESSADAGLSDASQAANERPRDAMFDSIADVCRVDPKLQGGRIAKARKQLAEAGYLPADVRAYGDRHRQQFAWQADGYRPPTLAGLIEHIAEVRSPIAGKIGTRGPEGNLIHGDGYDDLSASLKREQKANPERFGLAVAS